MVRKVKRLGALVLMMAAVPLVLAPATATADISRPSILGTWTTAGSPVGNPPIVVTARGSKLIGRAKVQDGCVKKGRPVWRIDSTSGGYAYGAVEYFNSPGCGSAGFGQAYWEVPDGSTSGQLCSFSPTGGQQYCQTITREGTLPPLPAIYGIDSYVLRCITVTTWFQPEQYCTQVYHAPGPGRWDTRVYYCNNPVGVACPKDLSVCALYPGQPCVQYPRAVAGLAPPRRGKSKKPKLATIAQGSFDFTDPGEGESSIDLVASKRATKRLKKLGKKRKTIQGYVVSSFTPASGDVTASTEGVKIRLP